MAVSPVELLARAVALVADNAGVGVGDVVDGLVGRGGFDDAWYAGLVAESRSVLAARGFSDAPPPQSWIS